ncbi:AAA family ATPase [Moellerella wisconsensis]|uniref:AAA family ATPase n=1 Tax=Moellerella wisconsensis TaxID=158849 RepID=UPI0030768814
MNKPFFGLGLTGAQGTGKTTLAKALSEKTGVPYFDANVRGIIKKHGFNLREPMSVLDRFKMQTLIAKELFEGYPDENFITDRTPVDVIAYTMAYVPPDLVQGSELEKEISCLMIDLITEARITLAKKFTHVVLVRGGISLNEEDASREDRAPMDFSYRLKMESLMEGEIFRFSNFDCMSDIHFLCMPREMTALDRRVNALFQTYKQSFDIDGLKENTFH